MKTRNILLAVLCGIAMHANAVHLRVHGNVSDAFSQDPISGVSVRVYKDGVKQYAFSTAGNGRYAIELDNGAQYVIRFSLPGLVSKSFAIDTHGGEREGDTRLADIEVDMTMFANVGDMDLSFFDMPMGMARFTPITGLLIWNLEYDQRVRQQVEGLMAEVSTRRAALSTTAAQEAEDRTLRQ